VARVLCSDEAIGALGARSPLPVDDLPGGDVRARDVADFARLDQIVQGPQRFRDGGQWVGPVIVVEIDVVRVEPPQAALDGQMDVTTRTARNLLLQSGHRSTKLGGDDDIVTVGRQGLAEHDLRLAAAVVVSAVEEGDATVQRGSYDQLRLRRVARYAE